MWRYLTNDKLYLRNTYIILFVLMLVCFGCEWHLRPSENDLEKAVSVQRYDRMEALYLTTGDVAALHQMNTDYPQQTRTLIEDMLQLGHVNDSDINTRFLLFFQDTTLQELIADVKHQYADMSDIDEQLSSAFSKISEMLPDLPLPMIYAQIGSLDQSIVVSDGALGISLDKYLGSDYHIYKKYGYSDRQRLSMTRSFIVPDCLGFYLLSLYPFHSSWENSREMRDMHMGRIQHVVNCAMGRKFFKNEFVNNAEQQMSHTPGMTYKQLLEGVE